jgi:hypothetical protein
MMQVTDHTGKFMTVNVWRNTILYEGAKTYKRLNENKRTRLNTQFYLENKLAYSPGSDLGKSEEERPVFVKWSDIHDGICDIKKSMCNSEQKGGETPEILRIVVAPDLHFRADGTWSPATWKIHSLKFIDLVMPMFASLVSIKGILQEMKPWLPVSLDFRGSYVSTLDQLELEAQRTSVIERSRDHLRVGLVCTVWQSMAMLSRALDLICKVAVNNGITTLRIDLDGATIERPFRRRDAAAAMDADEWNDFHGIPGYADKIAPYYNSVYDQIIDTSRTTGDDLNTPRTLLTTSTMDTVDFLVSRFLLPHSGMLDARWETDAMWAAEGEWLLVQQKRHPGASLASLHRIWAEKMQELAEEITDRRNILDRFVGELNGNISGVTGRNGLKGSSGGAPCAVRSCEKTKPPLGTLDGKGRTMNSLWFCDQHYGLSLLNALRHNPKVPLQTKVPEGVCDTCLLWNIFGLKNGFKDEEHLKYAADHFASSHPRVPIVSFLSWESTRQKVQTNVTNCDVTIRTSKDKFSVDKDPDGFEIWSTELSDPHTTRFDDSILPVTRI